MIRNAQLLIAYPILRDIRLAAELDGLPCGEDWAEMVLREALEKRPEITELGKMIDDAKAKAKKAWREKHLPKELLSDHGKFIHDDQLP